jgi:hypothetical protein
MSDIDWFNSGTGLLTSPDLGGSSSSSELRISSWIWGAGAGSALADDHEETPPMPGPRRSLVHLLAACDRELHAGAVTRLLPRGPPDRPTTVIAPLLSVGAFLCCLNQRGS